MHLVTKTFAALLISATGLQLAAQERYIPSTDGSEVTDSRTGLIWRRCA